MSASPTSAEDRLSKLGICLPAAPTPFGPYVPAVLTGGLLFLSGMLATNGHSVATPGVVGKDVDVEAASQAGRIAALNGLAVIKQQLGSLDRVSRLVRLGVSIAAANDFAEHVKVADAPSELLGDVFGRANLPSRIVLGVASLPLGSPVELEIIVEVKPD